MDSDSHDIADKIKWALPWALPLKLILGAFLGALGSAGLLGYLSEFATYSFAVYYGFRPPVEGIPYLKATVSYGSFFLLFSGAVVFLAVTSFVRYLVWYINSIALWIIRARTLGGLANHDRVMKKPQDFFRHISPQSDARVILIAFMAAIVFAMPMSLSNLMGSPEYTGFHVSIVVFYSVFGFLSVLVMCRPNWTWWISAIATMIYFFAWVFFLFSPQKYSEFLRLVGFGGGIPISMELRDPDNSQAYSRRNYYLMLRTTDSFILYEDGSGRNDVRSKFIEIPRDQVRSINHDVGGLLSLQSKLPRKSAAKPGQPQFPSPNDRRDSAR